MITEKERQSTLLSTTAKDYYQIWQELLETAGKLSERWSPESTNESDPGIVLLKVLTAIADKLNYNIDKNTLEAFMPSAAQEESMRKLCEMMGYNMKYYRSATTDVLVYFSSTNSAKVDYINANNKITLPKFNQFTNIDEDITYTSLEQAVFSKYNQGIEIPCIEGTINYCESDNDGRVTLTNLDDNYRYYFPVTNVAENGIFIYNLTEYNTEGTQWEQVSNLYIQPLGKPCYKFGYDSKLFLPYIQFPEDVGALIQNGLRIAYITTQGLSGNISAKALCTLVLNAETTESWKNIVIPDSSETLTFESTDFKCYNASAASNGENKESLNNAYKNFKRTIGTFDTLVTCRDYMNKIYDLTVSINDTTPLVSNVVVSDIRDDINNAITLCTFQDYGIAYLDKSLTYEDSTTHEQKAYIDNFDLIIYPFNTLHNLNTKSEYDTTFKFDSTDTITNIQAQLENYKTLAHKLSLPDDSSIACIKNYLKLNAKITTNTKVNSAEWQSILSNIKTEIFKNFNARQVDFKEAVPYDDILTVIQDADINIKNVSLDEPSLYTVVLTTDNKEYLLFDDYKKTIIGAINNNQYYDPEDENLIKSKFSQLEKEVWENLDASDRATYIQNNKVIPAKKYYNQLLLRNILAGRVALFDYDTQFQTTVQEAKAKKDSDNEYSLIYPEGNNVLTTIEPKLKITNINTINENNSFTVGANEVIQFRAPQFDTEQEYGAYVNYYLESPTLRNAATSAKPATFNTFRVFLNSYTTPTIEIINYAASLYDNGELPVEAYKEITTAADFASYKADYGCLYSYDNTQPIGERYTREDTFSQGTSYYVYELNKYTFGIWSDWLQKENVKYQGIYRIMGQSNNYPAGYLVDASHCKYIKTNAWFGTVTPLTYYYVQDISHPDTNNDGLGIDASALKIANLSEYELGDGEKLYINYTSSTSATETNSSTGDTNVVTTSTIVNKVYEAGTIIRPSGFTDGLKESSLVAADKTYSKTKTSGTGYDTSWNISGMFALGTSEKIEIRAPKETSIYDTGNTEAQHYNPTYVYFNINDKPKNNIITFLDAWEDPTEDPPNPPERILKENEYFWYTDINKQTLTFVGAGSRIVNHSPYAITKSSSGVSTEDILEKGLSIIPWITIPGLYKTAAGDGNYIQWQEYQYITLAPNDKLISINIDPNDEDTLDPTVLNSTWKKCLEATYKFDSADAPESLPLFDIHTATADSDYTWRVNCKLALKTGPSAEQTLKYDTNDNTKACVDETVDLYFNYETAESNLATPTNHLELTSHASPVSIKTNYLLDTIADSITTTWHQYNSDGDLIDTIEDFKVKVFKEHEAEIIEDEEQTTKTRVPLYNTNNYYTSIACGTDFFTMDWYCSLNDTDNQAALIMIYFDTPSNQATPTDTNPYLTIHTQDGSTDNDLTLSIYNYHNQTTPTWWDGLKVGTSSPYKYYLRKGINIVQITDNCKITVHRADDPTKVNLRDLIIFSPINIIDKHNFNPVLNYQEISGEPSLLEAINNLDQDHDFYYNVIVEDYLAIDLKTAKQEKMSNPSIWYDYNNINNKFVISEIDSDYLAQGITLARTSQK